MNIVFIQYIYLSIGQSTQQFLQWQNKHYCVNICLLRACDVVLLHVSTLLLGHLQACSNTGFSHWITMNYITYILKFWT
jgi:hypothetical protein